MYIGIILELFMTVQEAVRTERENSLCLYWCGLYITSFSLFVFIWAITDEKSESTRTQKRRQKLQGGKIKTTSKRVCIQRGITPC